MQQNKLVRYTAYKYRKILIVFSSVTSNLVSTLFCYLKQHYNKNLDCFSEKQKTVVLTGKVSSNLVYSLIKNKKMSLYVSNVNLKIT